jgi:hypothetical protein
MLAKAVEASVARWRNRAIDRQLPGLLPTRSDVKDTQYVGSYTLIDLSHITARMASGKMVQVKEVPEWKPEYAGHLRSAATGAQWTQTRRYMVPAFCVSDKRCQLCFGEDGTSAHRWRCPATIPDGGWTPLPPRAAGVEQSIGPRRTQLLNEHGLLTVAVPKKPWRKYDTFQWISEPPDQCRGDLVWYVDGSGYNTRWTQLATFGFAIVVVSGAGDLVAWALGVPPQWASSVADAEAWAVVTILGFAPAVPKIVTDCMSILQVARAGQKKANSAAMPLARVWSHASHALDGNLSALADGQLVWMPAHKSAKSFRNYTRSDKRTVSSLDWRANRLADILAKAAAEHGAVPKATARFLQDAEALVRYKAAMLGCVTFAANNHTETTLDADGKTLVILKRDATQPHARNRVHNSKGSRKTGSKKQQMDPWLDGEATAVALVTHSQQHRSKVAQKRRTSSRTIAAQEQASVLEVVRQRLTDKARQKHLAGDRSEARKQHAAELASTASTAVEATAPSGTTCTDEGEGCGAFLARTRTSGVSSATQSRKRPARGPPAVGSNSAVSGAMRRLLAGEKKV